MSKNRDNPLQAARFRQSDDWAAGPATWLAAFARNVSSQYGEDGIIEKILDVIGDCNKWCVEFGSRDGRVCSRWSEQPVERPISR